MEPGSIQNSPGASLWQLVPPGCKDIWGPLGNACAPRCLTTRVPLLPQKTNWEPDTEVVGTLPKGTGGTCVWGFGGGRDF